MLLRMGVKYGIVAVFSRPMVCRKALPGVACRRMRGCKYCTCGALRVCSDCSDFWDLSDGWWVHSRSKVKVRSAKLWNRPFGCAQGRLFGDGVLVDSAGSLGMTANEMCVLSDGFFWSSGGIFGAIYFQLHFAMGAVSVCQGIGLGIRGVERNFRS